VPVIFVAILPEVFAVGLIMPIPPTLIESFVNNNTANAAGIFRVFGTRAPMQFFFSSIRPACKACLSSWHRFSLH
jgi:DHA1 family tetracycline resistance protein-like MFS transporter